MALIEGGDNWRGASQASGIIDVLLTVLKAGIDVASGGRLISFWASDTYDTTGWPRSSHYLGFINMVGGRVSSNR